MKSSSGSRSTGRKRRGSAAVEDVCFVPLGWVFLNVGVDREVDCALTALEGMVVPLPTSGALPTGCRPVTASLAGILDPVAARRVAVLEVDVAGRRKPVWTVDAG